MQETNSGPAYHAQNASISFASTVTFTFMRACTIALVARVLGTTNQSLLLKNSELYTQLPPSALIFRFAKLTTEYAFMPSVPIHTLIS